MVIGKQLNVKITDYCNAKCSFCGYNRDALGEKIKSGFKPFVLDVDIFRKNFKYLKNKGIAKLHITGGEPMMHPHYRELIKSAKDFGFIITTGTNGSLLNEDIVKFLCEVNVDYLWLSLDTFPLSSHLEHRGFSQIEEKFRFGISLLKEYNINFFAQTVISHVIPKKDNLPDIDGHIDYYLNEFGIDRFVFSYPMYRPELDGENFHLATSGSDEVSFSKIELHEIYTNLIQIKSRRKDVKIVNPYLSLWQQIKELDQDRNRLGCYAGRDIFFLGEDQKSLRPCYFYSQNIIDMIDGRELFGTKLYEKCKNCSDQCFRDPSIIYFFLHHPFRYIFNCIKNIEFTKYTMNDIQDIIKNGSYKRAS